MLLTSGEGPSDASDEIQIEDPLEMEDGGKMTSQRKASVKI